MGYPAARITDHVLHDGPHCHAPIHPSAPVPTPLPHPPLPLPIVTGSGTVNVGGLPAARMGDLTINCQLGSCVPGGPGQILRGSATVMINGRPAARVNDPTSHPTCGGAIIPCGTGRVMPTGCPTVLIGG